MDDGSELLLVYGSLLQSQKHPYSHLLRTHGELLCKGKFPGRLYDLGHYPGAIYEAESTSPVFGELYRLKAPEKVIPILDKYEGIGSRFNRPYEFSRMKVPVTTEAGVFLAWVYLYNLDTVEKTIIGSGDYVMFKAVNKPTFRRGTIKDISKSKFRNPDKP